MSALSLQVLNNNETLLFNDLNVLLPNINNNLIKKLLIQHDIG